MALLAGHTEAIRVWGQLMNALPGEERAALMVELGELDNAVQAAFSAGHSEALKAWGQLLR